MGGEVSPTVTTTARLLDRRSSAREERPDEANYPRLGVTFVMLATIFALVIGGSLPASGQNGGSRVGSASIERLRGEAVGTVTVRIDRGTRYVGFARVAKGGDLFPGSRSATPQGKARGFFAANPGLFGIQDASAELRQVSSVKDSYGFTHVTFDQRYQGLPVFGGVIRAHLDRGNRLTAVNGTFTPNVELDVTPRLSASQAAQKAIAEVTANPPRTEENADAVAPAAPTGLRAASTTLEVYRMGLVRGVPGTNQLVIRGRGDERQRTSATSVFVHAHAGKILNRYSTIDDALFQAPVRGLSTASTGLGGGRPVPRLAEHRPAEHRQLQRQRLLQLLQRVRS